MSKKRPRKSAPAAPATIDGPEKIIIPVFGGVALLLLTITGVLGGLSYRQMASEQSAPGRVVELVLRQQMSTVDRADSTAGGRSLLGPSDKKLTVAQGFYYPVVEFKLPDGQLKTVQLEQGSWPAPYEKGDSVTVRYEPGKPLKAHIQSFEDTAGNFIAPMITGLLGLIFLTISGGLFYLGRKENSGPGLGLTDPDR